MALNPTVDKLPDTLIHRPASYVEPMDLAVLFPRLGPLELELGSGDGTFLAQWAALHPDRNFLGIERLLGRIRKLDRKGLRAGLSNLRAVRLEAAYFVKYLLPPRSVDVIHVYFPDPWSKRKQRKHRLINDGFTRDAACILKPGGVVYLRTDDRSYFTQMTEVFDPSPLFRPVETPAALIAVVTDFEREFNAQGIPTRRAAYALK